MGHLDGPGCVAGKPFFIAPAAHCRTYHRTNLWASEDHDHNSDSNRISGIRGVLGAAQPACGGMAPCGEAAGGGTVSSPGKTASCVRHDAYRSSFVQKAFRFEQTPLARF